MRLLLDTNIFLWWQWEDRRLPLVARETIENRGNDITVSAGTIWEICIKRQIGKLDFDGSPLRACTEAGFRLIDMTAAHCEAAGNLPRHHGDPFDRILIAQAGLEGLILMTQDRQFLRYDVPVLGVQ